MQRNVVPDQELRSAMELKPFGKVPAMRFEQLSDGRIFFRYVVEEAGNYPGFDGIWREMSAMEIRESLRMGGRVAEWLRSLDKVTAGKE